MSVLAGKNVVLGVSGGISAYKAAELCRLLRKVEATVRVVMTRAATEFITPLTLQTLSGHPVAQNLFDPSEEADIGHIRLADEADLVLIAPATADVIARMSAGRADDLLTAVVLATRAPVILAPAMNVNMWENPLTQANLGRLCENGRMSTIGPDAGALACGWIGAGRLVEPTEIIAAVEKKLLETAGSLAGKKVVITAGPTFEAIDDVRFLGNRSSGKMGFALAAEAARLGGEVTLVAGPVSLATPRGVARRVDVESALEMQAALDAAAGDADVVVMAAAVADFRPATRNKGKMGRREESAPTLALAANPDLLAGLAHNRKGARPLLVGFAAEAGVTGEALIERARAKLKEKACDVIVANDIAAVGFGGDDSAVTIVFRDGRSVGIETASKSAIARRVWSELVATLPARAERDATPPRRNHLRAT